jgi:hypothetical protein
VLISDNVASLFGALTLQSPSCRCMDHWFHLSISPPVAPPFATLMTALHSQGPFSPDLEMKALVAPSALTHMKKDFSYNLHDLIHVIPLEFAT